MSIEKPQMHERQKTLYVDAQFPWLAIAYHIPEAAHDDIPVLEIIENILTEGRSSRLYRKLVYENQSALSVSASVDKYKDPGLFVVTVNSIKKRHTPDEVVSIINDTLNQLKVVKVTERELEKARNQMETNLIFGLQTNFIRGIRIGFSLTRTGDPLGFIKNIEKYRHITADDIQKVARKYFVPGNRTIIKLLPKGKKTEAVDSSLE